MIKYFFLIYSLFTFSIFCQAQVSIHLTNIPASTPEGDSIFMAGNINSWNPGDQNFRFQLRNDGDYWLEIEGSDEIEFKFTRGTWTKAEGNESGGFRPNRRFTFGTADTLELEIESWEDLDGNSNGGGAASTANDQVSIWNEAIEMPQLGRERRVWIYLPQDYESSNRSCKVLYMHDGQNVFDASTSFSGEWKWMKRLQD